MEERTMKKNLLFAAAALVALAACTKESPVKEEGAIDASKLVFNIDVQNGNATKGVKTAWEDGDVVYVFFKGNSTQYVKMTCNGTSWDYADKDGGTTFTGLTLTATGNTLSAVYMPDFVVGAAKPSYDSVNSRWTFGSIAGYYQKTVDEGVSYTVTSTANVNTLNAVINLAAPSNIMQFYVPADQCAAPGAGNEYVLTATHVINYTFDGIVPGGAASQGNQLNGGAMQSYSGTLGSETGYYFWGILEGTGNYVFDCQLVKQNAEKKYAISSYSATKDLAAHSISSAAIKLTGFTDNGNFVDLGIGNCLWATGNLEVDDNDNNNNKIVSPLEAGSYFKYGETTTFTPFADSYYTGTEEPLSTAADVAYQVNDAWRIPTKAQFEALSNSDNTSWSWETSWPSGMLFTSKKNGISLFLAAAGVFLNHDGMQYSTGTCFYWSSTPVDADSACQLELSGGYIETTSGSRDVGCSVRPVQNK